MTTIEILVAARELLSDEKRWTKGAGARDVRGKEVRSRHPPAVCWCMAGALNKVIEVPWPPEALMSVIDLLQTMISGGIIAFNDNPATTHADVLRALDAAIEKAKQDD